MKHQNRIILGVVLGNLIEAFDLAICGLLSVYLAKYLVGGGRAGLLMIFATFFAGYLARPLGAFTLGLFSDVYGRKITLAASIMAMGISTASIGFIPSHEYMGHYSMILLLILRVIQSFSCGVEYLNSSAYLVENATLTHKGLSGSWASFGSTAGLLCASIVSLMVTWVINLNPSLEPYVWRLPFILALIGSSIGLYIRMFLPESLEYILYYSEQPKPNAKKIFKSAFVYCLQHKLKTLHVFFLSGLGVTTTFLFYIYGPTQAHINGLFNDNQIILSNIIALIVLLCTLPIAGKLSDKVPQDKLVIFSACGFVVLANLFFSTLTSGHYLYFIIAQSLMSIPSGVYYATVPVMLTNMYPLNLRCTVLSVIYAIAASLSAGITPIISLVLMQKTHSSSSPALIIAGLVGMTLITLFSKRLLQKEEHHTTTFNVTSLPN